MAAMRADVVGVAQRILDFADATLGRTAETSPRGEGRTGGMLHSRPRTPTQPRAQEVPGDMAAELKAAQKRMGIY
jgi:hypothetical protein